MSCKVAILGASPKPERYSHKAMRKLQEHGHKTFLVNGQYQDIEGQSVLGRLTEIEEKGLIVTVYVNPAVSGSLKNDFLAIKPRGVIFNPGSENPDLQNELEAAGIPTMEACTLVLLSTDQFDTAF